MILGLSCILMCFQAVPVLDINLNKSEIVNLGSQKNDDYFAVLLGVQDD